MVRSSNVVAYPMFLQVLLEALVDEVRTSITYHYPWNSESWKYYFFEHLIECMLSAFLHGMALTHLET